MSTRLALLLVIAAAGCATRRPPTPVPGEARGLYTVGFEARHFRPCGDTAALGEAVALDSAVAARLAGRWPEPGEVRVGAWTYDVYYVRWVLRDLPAPPAARPGYIHISNAPRRSVERVLELRAPRRGECGWQPPGGPP